MLDRIGRQFRSNPIVLVLGPRQCGKTTLPRLIARRRRLVRDVSESLAGRVAHVPMAGFDLTEAGKGSLRWLWWRP